MNSTLYTYLNQVVRDDASVVTVGTFDGVHAGHRTILDHLLRRAAHLSGPGTVVTFDPHPREVVGNGNVALLTSVDERARICRALGVEQFIVIPFTASFSRLTGREFVSDILMDRIGMREMVVGHDHHFGHGRTGNENLLIALSEELGFGVDVVPAQALGDGIVSSSEIRRMLVEEGDVERAARNLGYRYGFEARVVEGLHRGRKIGFPTANLELVNGSKVVPADGVYAVWVYLDEETGGRAGMLNIGVRPTFENLGRHIEVHILDFDQSVYGQVVRIEFGQRLRSERKFDNLDALVAQLQEDRARCTAFAAEVSSSARSLPAGSYSGM